MVSISFFLSGLLLNEGNNRFFERKKEEEEEKTKKRKKEKKEAVTFFFNGHFFFFFSFSLSPPPLSSQHFLKMNSQAVRVLQEEQRKVRVIVRVRPGLNGEPEGTCLQVKDDKSLDIINPKNRLENLVYK